MPYKHIWRMDVCCAQRLARSCKITTQSRRQRQHVSHTDKPPRLRMRFDSQAILCPARTPTRSSVNNSLSTAVCFDMRAHAMASSRRSLGSMRGSFNNNRTMCTCPLKLAHLMAPLSSTAGVTPGNCNRCRAHTIQPLLAAEKSDHDDATTA